MANTKIEWATKVWNPVTGCTPISAGCANCYAKRMATRLRGRHGYDKENPFGVKVHSDKLNEPDKWKTPQRVFVCSMGDIFHEFVTEVTLKMLHLKMKRMKQHTFILLTKRPTNAYRFYQRNLKWDAGHLLSDNIWIGVSVESQKLAERRIPVLLSIPSKVKFISAEPLLGPIDLSKIPGAEKLSWIIAGGETGPQARPCHPDWVRSLRDQCKNDGIPFFFKGWGVWVPSVQIVPSLSEKSYIGPIEKSTSKDFFTTTCCVFQKTNKKISGDFIDGKQYHEIPKI
jgi:protein gp37